jgi:hypothetical protein
MLMPDCPAMDVASKPNRSGSAMAAFVVSILVTVLSLVVILSNLQNLTGVERAILVFFPFFGLVAIYASWRDLRRRRSLRVEKDGDSTWYVWVEFDGSTRRSTRDPREDWDAEGDGDGDGGGGD